MLAYELEKPVEKVCIFMYELTLKKFGQILNPKCSNWNHCRVPMTRPEVCGLYNGIFDKDGNIRKPLHRFIIRILLMIMDHFLNIPCKGKKTEKGRRNIDDMFTGKGNVCFDLFNSGRSRRGGSGGGSGRGGKFGDEFGDALNEFYDETGLGNGFGAFNFDDFDNDDFDYDAYDGTKKKKNNSDDDLANREREGSDGSGRGSKTVRESMKDISDLYNKTVGKKKKKGQGDDETDDDGEEWSPKSKNKKPKPPPKKKKYKGNENRRYLGNIIPVLVHEPFDNSKPWTWVRRHAQQERVLEGTQIGRAKVRHYQIEEVERQVKEAKQRYSVRSNYSVQSVAETGMFGDGIQRKKNLVRGFNYKKLREGEPTEPEPPKKKKQK